MFKLRSRQNLSDILTNRAYLGIRVYKVKGEKRETRATWPPIIDELTFARVQEILKAKKPLSRKTQRLFYFLFIELDS